jgi:hypothetical protein
LLDERVISKSTATNKDHRLINNDVAIGKVFFRFHCLLIAYLIFRSAFLPRILGVLMAIAGLSSLINSSVNFLAPAFSL